MASLLVRMQLGVLNDILCHSFTDWGPRPGSMAAFLKPSGFYLGDTRVPKFVTLFKAFPYCQSDTVEYNDLCLYKSTAAMIVGHILYIEYSTRTISGTPGITLEHNMPNVWHGDRRNFSFSTPPHRPPLPTFHDAKQAKVVSPDWQG